MYALSRITIKELKNINRSIKEVTTRYQSRQEFPKQASKTQRIF